MLSGARGFQILSRRLGVELSQAQFNDIKDIDTKELDFNELRNVPSDFNLLPGMNVSGNIISGKRSIITYLIYPVIKTINTAMREP